MTKLVSLPLIDDLVDDIGNLTAGGLIRRSDATYVNTAGALAYSRGTRTNLVLYSGAIDNGAWASITAGDGAVSTTGGPLVATTTSSGRAYRTQAITTVVGTTYIFSAYVTAISGGEVNTSSLIYNNVGIAGTFSSTTTSTTGRIWHSFTATGTSTYVRIGLGCDATQTGAHSVTITNVQVEALPSGNVIGSDLMDQESLTARAAGYTLVVGAVYKIGTRTTLDFTTVGAADNTAGTYFICHTAANLGAGDVASTVNSPAKGSFHGTAMLAGSTELVTNGGFETAGAGAPDYFGTWTETIGGTDTIADSTGAGTFYLGAHAALLTYVDNGTTYVANTITTTAGKLYKLEFYTMATAEDKAGRYSVYDLTGSADIVAATTTGVTANTYTKVTKYFYTPASCVSVSIRMWTPTEAGGAYYDYVSVRQVQTAWTRLGTNGIEIDETEGTGGALKCTYVDNGSGCNFVLADANDLSSNLTVGETYQVTFKTKTTGALIFYIFDVPLSLNVGTLTSYTVYFKATNATTNNFYLSNFAAGEVFWLDDLTIKSVPDLAYLSPGTYTATAGSTATIPAEPRFEANGLLVEGEGTNLLPYSYNLDANWTETRTTGDDGQADPFNGTNASKIIEDTSNNSHIIALNVTHAFPDSVVHTYSLFAKAGTRTKFQLQGSTKAGGLREANVDLTAGTITNVDFATCGIVRLGSTDWYRVWGSYDVATGTTVPSVRVNMADDAGSVSYQGVADKYIYLYGAQLEATAYPTSYIPTNGCPVTRLTEAGSATNGYSWTMSTALKNSLGAASPSKGTMLVEWVPGYSHANDTNSAADMIVSLTEANAGASILYNHATAGNWAAFDGTNLPSNAEQLVRETVYTITTRFDSTVAAPTTGALKVSEKHSGTWTHGTATNYDGAFTLGTYLRLAYGNEYPFWIKNVRFVDYFALDAPAAFTFTDVIGAFLNTVYTSNTITPTSIDAVISIVGGTYSINGGAYTSAAGIIGPDDTVSVRVTSSANPLTAVSAVLTMGAQSDTFTVTTMSVGAGFLQGMRMVLGGFAPSEKDN